MSLRDPEGSPDVLLVEDNHGDVALVERAFETRELPGTVHVVNEGDDALDWVLRRGEFSDAPLPDLVLLDLNLPATDGHEILAAVREDAAAKRIPVIVLTSSLSQADVRTAYEQAANACVVKPVDPDEFADRIESLADFWLRVATLPPVPSDADS